jgi:large repetitive protein
VGLGPFVSFVHGTAKVGKIVEILGQGLSGTTSVSFNGTKAVFKVKSDTFVKATVPPGATTGPVTVTTPGGTLTSNLPFRVRPQILSFSPTSGPVGKPVTITGVSLTQTMKVIFGGIHASFTVNSDAQVTATVPSGAQSGHIAILTAGGKIWSVGDFTVTQ